MNGRQFQNWLENNWAFTLNGVDLSFDPIQSRKGWLCIIWGCILVGDFVPCLMGKKNGIHLHGFTVSHCSSQPRSCDFVLPFLPCKSRLDVVFSYQPPPMYLRFASVAPDLHSTTPVTLFSFFFFRCRSQQWQPTFSCLHLVRVVDLHQAAADGGAGSWTSNQWPTLRVGHPSTIQFLHVSATTLTEVVLWDLNHWGDRNNVPSIR